MMSKTNPRRWGGKPFGWIDAQRAAFVGGNQVRLLIGGEAFFDALVQSIDQAQSSLFLETYIFNDDASGQKVLNALCNAALRRVTVRVTIDAFGSANFPQHFSDQLTQSGVQWSMFRPKRSWWPSQRRLRRLHRKLCVIDERIAFCGGINILDDYYDPNHGVLDQPRFDFAVQIQGPLVAAVSHAVRHLWVLLLLAQRQFLAAKEAQAHIEDLPNPMTANVHAAFIKRDNLRNRSSIEREYLRAIGHARRDILICNAYFIPGHRLTRALVLAAQRGVKVTLLLQGKQEYWFSHYATNALYGQLIEQGIVIHEYQRSFLHAKVAVIDGQWATVGSSNLDPFSMLLAREANIIVRDQTFAVQLQSALQTAIIEHSAPVTTHTVTQRTVLQRVCGVLTLRLLRGLLWVLGGTQRY